MASNTVINAAADISLATTSRAEVFCIIFRRIGCGCLALRLVYLMSVCAGFSLPIIVLAGFFPLDMPTLFNIGDDLSRYASFILNPHNGSGRYFPVYWIYHVINFKIFGAWVGGHYIVQCALFFGVAALLGWAASSLSGIGWVGFALIPFLYLGSPVAENLATIGKPETLSALLLTSLLALFYRGLARETDFRLSIWILVSLLFCLAMWTKETAVVLFVGALAGLGTSAALRRTSGRAQFDSLRPYWKLLAALMAGYLLCKAPYFVFSANKSGANYTDYSITLSLIAENFEFYALQQPDVILGGGVCTGLLVIYFLKNRRAVGADSVVPWRLPFVVCLCAIAWAYYCGLLIWRWAMPYYMLLPSLLFKVCLVCVLAWFSHESVRIGRWWVRVSKCYVVAAVLYGGLSFYYVAGSQIGYSIVYSDALDQFLRLSVPESRLVVESYPFYAEQIEGTGSLLSRLGQSHRVSGVADALDPAVNSNAGILKLLKVTPESLSENYSNLPRRGDYLIAFTGNKLATWFLRGVTPYYNEDSLMKRMGMYEMDLVASRESYLPALYINTWSKLPSAGMTSVGYKLYRVKSDAPRMVWRGRYPDGWIGNTATLLVNPEYGKRVVLRLSAPDFTLPNKVLISLPDGKRKEVVFNNSDEQRVVLSEEPLHYPVSFRVEVEKAISPASLGMNKDSRRLGLRIDLLD